MKSIVLPESLQFFEDDAFDECISLRTITAPRRFREQIIEVLVGVYLSHLTGDERLEIRTIEENSDVLSITITKV